jgi:hypothetical protein
MPNEGLGQITRVSRNFGLALAQNDNSGVLRRTLSWTLSI